MRRRTILGCILIAYVAILIKVLVFKDLPVIRIGSLILSFGGADGDHPANFIPFRTIGPYLLGYKGWVIAGINLLGNIGLFVPIGFLMPFVYGRMSWKQALALATGSGLLVELLQTVLHVGIFDIDDVILNGIGVMLGYGVFRTISSWMRSKKYWNIVITGIMIAAAIVALLYVLYPSGKQPVAPVIDTDTGTDLCGATNGTGQIVNLGTSTIIIAREDEVIETFTLTDQTLIKNSAGPVMKSDLEVGQSVTVITDESESAMTVLVCGKYGPKP